MRILDLASAEFLGMYLLPPARASEHEPSPALIVLHLALGGHQRNRVNDGRTNNGNAGRLVASAMVFAGKQDAIKQGGGTHVLQIAGCVPALLS